MVERGFAGNFIQFWLCLCAPGQRYYPAIVVQVTATLNEMFPKRYWIVVGSGQWLNKHITGERWPNKAERKERPHPAKRAFR